MNLQITSTRHQIVQHFTKLLQEASYRSTCQSIVLEGIKPILEHIKQAKKILYTPDCEELLQKFTGEKIKINEAILHKISKMNSPEGLIAEMAMPAFCSLQEAQKILVLDAINDPGNMGTLLRTAVALGWDTCYLLPGGCDVFNDKVVRAARGAHFMIRLCLGTSKELKQWQEKQQAQAFAATLDGEVVPFTSAQAKKMLVLGNEAHGVSADILSFCQKITIPLQQIDSLNVAVAGGILCYLLGKN